MIVAKLDRRHERHTGSSKTTAGPQTCRGSAELTSASDLVSYVHGPIVDRQAKGLPQRVREHVEDEPLAVGLQAA
jgi:hypothetical protein